MSRPVKRETETSPPPVLQLPGWALSQRSRASLADSAFAAGIALKCLDDLVLRDADWAGCWRNRQALRCATVAVRLAGRREDEAMLRDAVLLTSDGDAPGPAGAMFSGFAGLSARDSGIGAGRIRHLAVSLGLPSPQMIEAATDLLDDTLQSASAPPVAAAELVRRWHESHPEAEVLAWGLADLVIANRLNWVHPVPLMMTTRYSTVFRTGQGRGRLMPGEPGFAPAFVTALAEGAVTALRLAGEIERGAVRLGAARRRVRTKGADRIVTMLLGQDAVPATVPSSGLSRWASARMFQRLEALGAVRELSGRSSFRIYGL
ncbi:DUF1403 family protein [Martelella sp. HB161492]|uniref:DUF1403 family protein n=1 Tax=Martelella sp. HB161492 TaxID=2720726 RepID=UPI001590794B|nr:DUF1403 family protein [Martelella sp. HB161492]